MQTARNLQGHAPKLLMEDLPDTMGRRFDSGMAGTTEVPGVGMAANATGLSAQAGALVGSHINTAPATTDTDAALAAGQGEAPAL